MSESFERVLGVRRLPVFPLPLVLLPHEILPLHIFEPRYRRMLSDIEAGNKLFGVSYYNVEEMDSEKPEIGSIGCVAEVRESNTFEDGRSNILTAGIIRYRIDGYVETGEPYFLAEVTFFEDFEEETALVESLTEKVFDQFKRVAAAAHDLSGNRGPLSDIPRAEPEMLSFLVAAAFNLPTDVKNDFLTMRTTSERLSSLDEILRQAVAQVEESAAISKAAKTNGHSKKKIDLDL
jgi:ATP-dependent Lon protease